MLDKVLEACKKYNKSCGTQLANPTRISIEEAIKKNYTFIILSSDLFVLSNWSKNISQEIMKFKKWKKPSLSELFVLKTN